jgi:hypothetical protein
VGRHFTPDSAWTREIDVLGPDACEEDRCAPCAYWHRKTLALAGYQLPDDDARFVGVGVGENPPPGGGWRYPVLGGYESIGPELRPRIERRCSR